MQDHWVHLSVDDVQTVLQDLAKTPPDKVWQHPFWNDLKEFHEEYGMKISLYCFAEHLPVASVWGDACRNNLASTASWLKFGFHAGKRENHYTSYTDSQKLEELKRDFSAVRDAVLHFAGPESFTNTIRLHYFSCSEPVRKFLEQEGIRVLLSADDDRISYDLTAQENRILRETGSFQKGRTHYLRTDFRYEKVSDILSELESRRNQKGLVLFTHENQWSANRCKIQKSLQWLSTQGRRFVTDITSELE